MCSTIFQMTLLRKRHQTHTNPTVQTIIRERRRADDLPLFNGIVYLDTAVSRLTPNIINPPHEHPQTKSYCRASN